MFSLLESPSFPWVVKTFDVIEDVGLWPLIGSGIAGG